MTQAELAQMAPMMGGGNNPLEMSALTQGNMGYLPNAQMMTPSSMGAFRTLPDMAYQQPVNQQAGYLKSLGTAALSSYGFNYNPAVNPILQRVEAERLVHDTNTSTWGAAGATALDFALPAIAGYIGKGLKAVGKVPLLGRIAGPLGGMLMPLTIAAQMASSFLGFEGVQDKIANARALQRLTRGKIVSGNSMDEGMMSGFSTKAAREIDKHLYRTGLMDGVYDQEDYRRMMSEGIQAGLFDYANTPEQYKKTLRNIRDNMSTVMEVTGSQDFTDVMKQLKRLQDMGATQQEYKSILRKENMYARITGMSHEDLINTYGQMGALEFNQRGLNQMAGSQLAMHNASVVTMLQRNGQLSNVTLAAQGGISGLAQTMTSQEADARKTMEEPMLLAFIDPTTGKIRKDAKKMLNSYLSSGQEGYDRLVKQAKINSNIIQNDFGLLQKYRENRAENANDMWNSLGDDATAKMFIMAGRKALRSDTVSNNRAFTAGAWAYNIDPVAARAMREGYASTEQQKRAEAKLKRARDYADYEKQHNFFSSTWRGIKRFFMPYVNEGVDAYTDSQLEEGEREAEAVNMRRYSRGMSQPVSTLVANYVADQNKQQKASDAVKKIVTDYSKASMVYSGDQIKGIDITPMITSMMKQIVKATNKELGTSYYTRAFEKILNSADGVSLKQALEKVGKTQAKQLNESTKASDIKDGTVFFNEEGTNAIGVVQGGKVLSYDADGSTQTQDVATFAKQHKGSYYVNMEEANRNLGGGSNELDFANLSASSERISDSINASELRGLVVNGELVDKNTPGVINYDDGTTNSLIIKELMTDGSKENFEKIKKFYKKRGVDIGSFEDFTKFLGEKKNAVLGDSPDKLGKNTPDFYAEFAKKTAKGVDGAPVDQTKLTEATKDFLDDNMAAMTAVASVLSNDEAKDLSIVQDVNKLTPIKNVGNQTTVLAQDLIKDEDLARNRLLLGVENNSLDANRTNMESALLEELGEGATIGNSDTFLSTVKKYTNADMLDDDFDKGVESAWADYLKHAKHKDGTALSDEEIEKYKKNKELFNTFKTASYSVYGTDSTAYRNQKVAQDKFDKIGNKIARTSKSIEETLNFATPIYDSETAGNLKTLTDTAINKEGLGVGSVSLANAVVALQTMSQNATSDEDKAKITEYASQLKQMYNMDEEKSAQLDKVISDRSTAEDISTFFKGNKRYINYYNRAKNVASNGYYQKGGRAAFGNSLKKLTNLTSDMELANNLQVVDNLTKAGVKYTDTGGVQLLDGDVDVSKLSKENAEAFKKIQERQTSKGITSVSLEDFKKLDLGAGMAKYQAVLNQAKKKTPLFSETSDEVKVTGLSDIKENTDAMKNTLEAIKNNTTSATGAVLNWWNSKSVGDAQKKINAGAR